jgi:hypothetical protein
MDAKSADTRPRLSHRVGALVDVFETVIYAIAFLLLVAAAILVVIGGAEAVVQAAEHKVNTLQGGVLVLDRVLMVLIVAEIAATLRAVLLLLELGALGLLVIGIAAAIFMIRVSTKRAAHADSDYG